MTDALPPMVTDMGHAPIALDPLSPCLTPTDPCAGCGQPILLGATPRSPYRESGWMVEVYTSPADLPLPGIAADVPVSWRPRAWHFGCDAGPSALAQRPNAVRAEASHKAHKRKI